MVNKTYYKEEQKFGSFSLYISMGIIYIGTLTFFIYALYSQLILNEPLGDKPVSDKGLILTSILIPLVLLVSGFFLFGSKLVTTITKDNINITFKPLLAKSKTFSKSEIKRYELRTYKPIMEYGGWGIKQGKKSKGKAYNVKGNKGLQLYLSNGKKVLIGTQRVEAITRAMKKMMESN